MLRVALVLVGLLLPLTGASVSDPPPFLNLDFERVTPDGTPKGWRVGGRGYSVVTDSVVVKSGVRSLRFRRTQSASDRFASTVTSFPVALARGRTLRISAWIRTHAVTNGYAGLWGRVGGEGRATLAFDNMQGRGAEGTTGWTRYTLTLDVGDTADHVVFGALLAGDGTAWIDDLRITVDGEPFVQRTPPIVRPSDAQLAWLRAHLVPFDGVDPSTPTADLAPVSDFFGDARFVALGEPTHGSREVVQVKHRLIRHFAERGNRPLVVALEASLPEARAVNRYVQTGVGTARDVVNGLGTWTYRTDAFVAFVEWMRAHVASGGSVAFAGFDVQAPTVAMDSVRRFVRRVDPTYTDAVDAAYTAVDSVYNRRNRLSHEGPSAFTAWTDAARMVLDTLSVR